MRPEGYADRYQSFLEKVSTQTYAEKVQFMAKGGTMNWEKILSIGFSELPVVVRRTKTPDGWLVVAVGDKTLHQIIVQDPKHEWLEENK